MNDISLFELFHKKASHEHQDVLAQNKLLGLYPEIDKRFFMSNWLLNQAYQDELKSWKLPNDLDGVLLKGAHLISNYYPHIGQRFMGDIDILIENRQLEGWKYFLSTQGYREITPATWAANEFKNIFLKKSGSLELVIEIHTRLFYQETKYNKWDQHIESPYPGLYFLNPNYLFIHLCGHLAYQHTFLSLHWLYDIFLISQSESFNISMIKSKAKEAHVLRSCQIIAYILEKYLKLKTMIELKPIFPIRLLIDILISENFLKSPRSYPIRYLLIKHFTKDYFYHSLKYDIGWFLKKRTSC
jgi:hypothetical protein